MAILTVTAGQDLQAVIDSCDPGDTIQAEAAATFTGPFTLPDKGSSSYCKLTTTGTLPSPGTRVTSGDAGQMPTIQAAAGGEPAIRTATAAHHWILSGLHVPASPTITAELVTLGSGDTDQNSLAQVPHHLILDRCYLHGDTTNGQKRGLSLQSGQACIVDCCFQDFKLTDQDSQAIAGWNGPGPYHIQNTLLEGAGENLLFGGADAHIANLSPSNILVTGCDFNKPTAWRGVYQVKTLLELKNAKSVRITASTFTHCWVHAQQGYAVLFNVRNQDGTNTWATVQDVEFDHNTIDATSSGFNILGQDDERAPSQSVPMNNVNIHHVLLTLDNVTYDGRGWLALIQRAANHVVFNHVTCINPDGDALIVMDGFSGGSPIVIPNFTMENTIGFLGNTTPPYGIFSSVGQGNAAIAAFLPGSTFAKNVFIGTPTDPYPTNNFYPANETAVGFVDYGGGDYRLAPSSPYHHAGTDGTDPGYEDNSAPVLPGTPTTPSPADAATLVTTSPTLTWSAINATTYDLAFGQTNPPPTLANGLTVASFAPGLLANATLYYWQITAYNADGATPGPVWSFSTVPAAPDVVTTPSPTDGQLSVANTPTLTWAGGSGADTFTIRLGLTTPPAVVATGLLSAAYTPGALASGTLYYWRVDAVNAEGTTNGPVWTFTTVTPVVPPAAPATPEIPVPSDTATLVDINPTLTWQSARATSYDLAFDTSSPPAPLASGLTSATYAPGPLAYNTLYYWRITAINPSGSTVGPIWSFTTDTTPPTPPDPVPPDTPNAPSPADASSVSMTTAGTLTWAAAGGTQYDMAFGTTGSPPTVATGLVTPSFAPTGLVVGTTYYWQVTAQNDDGTTAGPVWSFTVIELPNGAIFFQDSGDGVTRDGSFLDPAQDWTRATWTWLIADISASDGEYTVWNLGPSDFSTDWMWIGGVAPSNAVPAGTDPGLRLYAENFNSIVGDTDVTQAPRVWVYAAAVYRASPKTISLVVNGVTIGMNSSDLSAVSPQTVEVMGSADTGDLGGVGAACARVWQAALTDAELLAEKASESAVRTADLLADTPLSGPGDLVDISGNGHDWALTADALFMPGPFDDPATTNDQVLAVDGQVIRGITDGVLTGQTNFLVDGVNPQPGIALSVDLHTTFAALTTNVDTTGVIGIFDGPTGALLNTITAEDGVLFSCITRRSTGTLLVGVIIPTLTDTNILREYADDGTLVHTYPGLSASSSQFVRLVDVFGDTVFYALGAASPLSTIVHRYDLNTETRLTDLVTFNDLSALSGIRALSDGGVIVTFGNEDSLDGHVQRVSNAGATTWQQDLSDYPNAGALGIALASDGTTVWIFEHPQAALHADDPAHLFRLALTDGSITHTDTLGAYNGFAIAAPLVTAVGTITVIKHAPGSDASFPFTASAPLSPTSFSLTDGGSQVFSDVPPGTYTILELTPAGYVLSSVVSSNGSPFNALTVAEGEAVTVTFTNTPLPEGDALYVDQNIRWLRRSPHVTDEKIRLTISRVELDMQIGVGTATGGTNAVDPQVIWRDSKDGGQTWSQPVYMTLGELGRYFTRVFTTRRGQGRDWVFEVSGDAPVETALAALYATIQKGTS